MFLKRLAQAWRWAWTAPAYSAANRAGYQAFLDGLPREACPSGPGAADWRAGWDDGNWFPCGLPRVPVTAPTAGSGA